MPCIPCDVITVDGKRQLNHAHAAFDKATCQQTPLGVFAVTVHLERLFRFLARIKRVWNRELHAVGHFHRLNTGLQLWIMLLPLQIQLIESRQQVRLMSLVHFGQPIVLQILHNVIRLHLVNIHVGSCISTRQKRVPPVGQFIPRLRTWTHGDEARQILVLGAQTISQPRSHAGTSRLQMPDVHHHHRAGMFRRVRMHRMDEAEIIDQFCHVRKNLTDPPAALTILPKRIRRWHQSHFCVSQRLAIDRFRPLARVFGNFRLIIERVDLRWPSRHKQLNHVLRLRGEMRSPRSQRRF